MSNARDVKQIIKEAACGDSAANKLYFDRHTNSWRPTRGYRNPDAGLSISDRERTGIPLSILIKLPWQTPAQTLEVQSLHFSVSIKTVPPPNTSNLRVRFKVLALQSLSSSSDTIHEILGLHRPRLTHVQEDAPNGNWLFHAVEKVSGRLYPKRLECKKPWVCLVFPCYLDIIPSKL